MLAGKHDDFAVQLVRLQSTFLTPPYVVLRDYQVLHVQPGVDFYHAARLCRVDGRLNASVLPSILIHLENLLGYSLRNLLNYSTF